MAMFYRASVVRPRTCRIESRSFTHEDEPALELAGLRGSTPPRTLKHSKIFRKRHSVIPTFPAHCSPPLAMRNKESDRRYALVKLKGALLFARLLRIVLTAIVRLAWINAFGRHLSHLDRSTGILAFVISHPIDSQGKFIYIGYVAIKRADHT